MKLYRAVKTNILTQKFGENKNDIYKTWGLLGHNGMDWSCLYGEPIYWDGYDCEGTVVQLSNEPNEGMGVVIQTKDKDGFFQHRFWHLKEFACKVGQILNSGDLIGYGDSTGYSTGNHLHRDLKPLAPGGGLVYPDNGYNGAVDPMPYFTNIFIRDTFTSMELQLRAIKLLLEKIKRSLIK